MEQIPATEKVMIADESKLPKYESHSLDTSVIEDAGPKDFKIAVLKFVDENSAIEFYAKIKLNKAT